MLDYKGEWTESDLKEQKSIITCMCIVLIASTSTLNLYICACNRLIVTCVYKYVN